MSCRAASIWTVVSNDALLPEADEHGDPGDLIQPVSSLDGTPLAIKAAGLLICTLEPATSLS